MGLVKWIEGDFAPAMEWAFSATKFRVDDPLTGDLAAKHYAIREIYLAELHLQVAVSQDLLQDSPCTRSTGSKQVSRLRAGEKTAQACDIAC
jgi:hypothetical protein